MRRTLPLAALLAAISPLTQAVATDLVTLSPQNYDAYAPAGKEVDAVYGDFVLRNGRLTAVIARPVRMRNANMVVRDVGGMIIDLARHGAGGGDQLQVLYAAEPTHEFQFAGVEVDRPEVYDVERFQVDGTNQPRPTMMVRARSVTLKLLSKPDPDRPLVELCYTLSDGDDAVRIESTWTNETGRNLTVRPADALRAERTFAKAPNGEASLFWVEDRWFGQAYGVRAAEGTMRAEARGHVSTLAYLDDGDDAVTLGPGASVSVSRHIFPAADLLGVRAIASSMDGDALTEGTLTVRDTNGAPVAGADVTVTTNGTTYAHGRTGPDGRLTGRHPEGGDFDVEIVAPWGDSTDQVEVAGDGTYSATVAAPGRVVATISGMDGGPIPCKVQFVGKGGTKTPDFGPDTGEHAIANLYYSENGRFERLLAPGDYDVIVSYGPEYDAVFTELKVERGKEAMLAATLKRTVDTTGWVSSDFHSHSTPSGDNSSSQRGRVLNLLCEQIEFAPCTEHNRLSTYVPHLRDLGVERLMATCTGMELTSVPGTVNHQNAFPLTMRPHIQDHGAPSRDLDPEMQVERLALWDGYSDKLIQLNHPDLGQVFYDRNGDGEADQGFRGMFGAIDVIEVHPPHTIFEAARLGGGGRGRNNTIVNWMQLLNQGFRYPGVVNTDAHYNHHGSGWRRNYLKSPTDDPAEVDTMDMVHAAEGGHLVMSTGPFLEVVARSNGSEAIPGDDLELSGGSATLHVKVQCPNWFDVDRVQVFVNGAPDPELNYTRESNPDAFADGVVKFDRELPLSLESDAHVIVVAIGEHSRLGPVMGEGHADDPPVAVSNPIFIDADGGGFKASGETLGAPLPTKAN